MKFLVLISFFSIFFISCSKEDVPPTEKKCEPACEKCTIDVDNGIYCKIP